jgi:hypothetical protein
MQKSYPGTLCLRELEPEVLGSSSIEAVLCIKNGIKQNCLLKYRPPTPLTAQQVCPPLTANWGRTQLQGGEGGGGFYMLEKTPDTALYSTYVSTLYFVPP